MTRVRPRLNLFAALALAVCAAAVAWSSGHNGAYAVLSVVVGVVGADLLVGRGALAGLQVSRRLPDEVFAGQDAAGALVVRATARALWALHLRDLAGGERVLLDRVPPGEAVEVAARWRFERRGIHPLSAIRVATTWPFGLFVRQATLEVPAEVLVYPALFAGGGHRAGAHAGGDRPGPRVDAEGDFAGLRPYVPGDPPRDLHWATTARTGAPMIVVRAGASVDRCVIRVDPAAPDFERELSRAVGEVERAIGRGAEVGVDLPSGITPPRSGPAWRRVLLERLATEPSAPGAPT